MEECYTILNLFLKKIAQLWSKVTLHTYKNHRFLAPKEKNYSKLFIIVWLK